MAHMTHTPYTRLGDRGVLFEFHLKFWNTASIGFPARSLLIGRQTQLLNEKEKLLDGIQIKHL